MDILASNSMTILNGLNYSFAGSTFEKISIPHANLCNAQLSNCQFKNSNLKDINFKNAQIESTKFLNCNLENAQNGYLPDLSGHQDWITCLEVSKKNMILFSGSRDSTIK